MARAHTVQTTKIVREPDSGVDRGRLLVNQIIWLIAGVILLLLAFRFLFALLGANPANGFANFIYSTSHPLVAPFFGLFSYNDYQLGASRFEVYTLVAMLVYSAIAWGLTALANLGRPVVE